MKKIKGQPYYTNRHSCFLLQYHIVLVTKYRHPILEGKIKESVYTIIQSICDEKGYNILEMNGEPDHIHILLETGTDMKPQEFINIIKTKTARFTRRDYGELLKKWYWKPLFWSDSYFISTVGINTLDVVKQYIQNQSRGHSPTHNIQWTCYSGYTIEIWKFKVY